MKCWSNGELLQEPKTVTSFNFSLNYSYVAWEGMRAYKQADGSSKIYKLEEHMQRLYNSAKLIGIDIPVDINDAIKGANDLAEANGGGDLYFRPIVYLTTDCEGVRQNDVSDVSLDIYAIPMGNNYSREGIKVGISSFPRGYPAFNMQAKISPNYGMLKNYYSEAERLGVDDMLIQNFQGYIVEAIVANLFIVKDGVIYTPKDNGDILPGITRKTVIEEILPKTKFKVEEKNLTRTDFYIADEIFMCGTYAEITKIKEIDGYSVGTSSEVFDIVSKEYSKLVRGNNE
jgi:branched-chain amino acid aminotransferase